MHCVLGPDDVGVPDDQQRRRRYGPDVLVRPARECAVQFTVLGNEDRPRAGIRRHPQVGLVPGRTGEIVRGGFLFREHFRVETIGPVGGAARVHEPSHHARVLHGQLQGDGAAHAVADKIGYPNAECVQKHRGVGRHLLVGQWPAGVSGMAVAL
jgi:hypothetical protein